MTKFRDVYEQVNDRLKYVCIDVANGYSSRFRDTVSDFRMMYPNIVIIAGNVVTGEMTEELILAGADIVKVGLVQEVFVLLVYKLVLDIHNLVQLLNVQMRLTDLADILLLMAAVLVLVM